MRESFCSVRCYLRGVYFDWLVSFLLGWSVLGKSLPLEVALVESVSVNRKLSGLLGVDYLGNVVQCWEFLGCAVMERWSSSSCLRQVNVVDDSAVGRVGRGISKDIVVSWSR